MPSGIVARTDKGESGGEGDHFSPRQHHAPQAGPAGGRDRECRGKGRVEPDEVETVMVSVDGGPPMEATVTVVPHQQVPTMHFAAFVDTGSRPDGSPARTSPRSKWPSRGFA